MPMLEEAGIAENHFLRKIKMKKGCRLLPD
jgi:hypothetical protein